MTRILFVDDDRRILDGLRRLLSPRRKSWIMQFADSGGEALALLENDLCDVIVSDMRMPQMDGGELLRRVQAAHPQIVRVVLSGSSELDPAVRAAPVAHRFVSKPCDPPDLLALLDSLVALKQGAPPELLAKIGAIRTLPATSAHQSLLASLLASPHTSLERVAGVIERDVAMAAQVLHLMRSGFFRPGGESLNLREATTQLGLQALRALFTAQALSCPPTPALAAVIERRNRHAIRVGFLTRALTRDLADGGETAGLFHDLGAWFEDDARDCEGDARHASGQTLMALWGLPSPLPLLAQAVQTADRLVCAHEASRAAPELDAVETGLIERVPDWREQLARLDLEAAW